MERRHTLHFDSEVLKIPIPVKGAFQNIPPHPGDPKPNPLPLMAGSNSLPAGLFPLFSFLLLGSSFGMPCARMIRAFVFAARLRGNLASLEMFLSLQYRVEARQNRFFHGMEIESMRLGF